jgi:uncharacterized protein (DUF2126 family)
VWRVPELLAAADDTDCATANDTAQFCAALEVRLQVDPSPIHSAYEDIHYHLWREHRLPANVLADDARLADPMERARLARVLGHGLGAPVGSALPLRRAVHDDVRIWQRGKWHFRGDAVFLLPVIRRSAIGCRWMGCPGWIPKQSSTRPSPIRLRRTHSCRRANRSALPCRRPTLWALERMASVRLRRMRRWSTSANPTWCAPRLASSRATVSSTCSSRGSMPPRIGWRWSPWFRTSPANSVARWCWKAICRRAIRIFCISR